MPLYLTQFSYTAETWAALAANPEDREAAVRAAAEQFGCRLVFFAYMLGEHDGVAIIEAPDEAAVTALLLAALTTGSYRATRTAVLVPAGAMVDILRRTAGVAFRAPGR